METYCVSCKNNTGNKHSTVKTTKNKQVIASIKLRCFWLEKIEVDEESRSSLNCLDKI